MLYCVLLCGVVLYGAVLAGAVLCSVVQCCVVPYCTLPQTLCQCCVVPCCTLPQTLCQWMADQAPLGHKRPREDGSRYRWCPPCSTRGVAVQLTARQASSSRLHFSPCILSLLFASPIPRHVLLECQAACAAREETGIAEFLRQAKAAGRGRDSAAQLFLSGKDLEGEPIAAGEWLDRGAALKTLQEQWLASQ